MYIDERMKMMNLNKTVFLSGLAVIAMAVPTAPAADPNAGPRMSGDSRGASAPRFAAPQSDSRSVNAIRSGDGGSRWSGSGRRWGNGDGRRWSNGDGRRWRNGDGRRWGNRDGRWRGRYGNWRHRRYYPAYYYSSFYPYGYGNGWYGYPYYGTSAHLYYHGTGNRYGGYQAQGSGNLVIAVQQELRRAGYYRGAVDGVIGSGTRSAIRAYERAHGLPADGRIDDELLGQMGLS